MKIYVCVQEMWIEETPIYQFHHACDRPEDAKRWWELQWRDRQCRIEEWTNGVRTDAWNYDPNTKTWRNARGGAKCL